MGAAVQYSRCGYERAATEPGPDATSHPVGFLFFIIIHCIQGRHVAHTVRGFSTVSMVVPAPGRFTGPHCDAGGAKNRSRALGIRCRLDQRFAVALFTVKGYAYESAAWLY
jgi:hypothetical protein